MILAEILSDDYEILEASDGIETLKILFEQKVSPTAILLDIIMPGMDGFEVLHEIKTHPETEKIPVLFITAADADTNESRGLKSGAADYVSKPFNPDVVKTRLENHINLTRYQNELEELVEEKTAELQRTNEQTLEVLADIVENRDETSGAHIKRTSELSAILIRRIISSPKYAEYAKANGLDQKVAGFIVRATTLHDIGKIKISDNILLAPRKLTDEEFNIMKKHTTYGGEIIDSILEKLGDNVGYFGYSKQICLGHHERWDGRGYPRGIKGDAIPFSARLLSVVDVYDALVSKRPYKDPFPHDEAIGIIVKGGESGQFDPTLVEAFVEVADEIAEFELSLKV
jgi:putative two-component system response regulator